MNTLFQAVNISGLASNIAPLLLGFIAVGLLFVTRRYINKVIHEPSGADFSDLYD